MWRIWALAASLLVGPLAAETLSGRLLEDHTGNPLASAEIRIFAASGPGALAELESDSDGRFHTDLPKGEYRLEIAKTNYTNAALYYRIAANPPVLNVRLVRCGVIAGHVNDSAGRPVRGARVVALLRSSPSAPWRPGTSAMSDDRGQYRIYGLPAGQHVIAAEFTAATDRIKAGVVYYPDSLKPRQFTVSGGEEFTAIDLNAPPGGTFRVSGRVDGAKPDLGYSIALTPVEQPAILAARVNAAADGSFHFEGIPGGRYFVFVAGPVLGWTGNGAVLGDGAVYGRGAVDVGGQDVENLAIKIGAVRGLTVLLRAPSGGACPASGRIVLRPLEDWGAAINLSATAAVGKEQRFDRLPPGRFQVMVGNLGDNCFVEGDATVDLAGAGDDRPVLVPLAAAGAIRGRVAGTEAGGQYVVLLVPDDATSLGSRVLAAFPDIDGQFRMAGLRPGRYRIAARRADGPAVRWMPDLAGMMEIVIAGGSPTDLELPVSAK